MNQPPKEKIAKRDVIFFCSWDALIVGSMCYIRNVKPLLYKSK